MKKTRSISTIITLLCMGLVAVVALVAALNGKPGNPTETNVNQAYWRGEGPFELSIVGARFALTYSLLENHSYFFSPYLAVLATPDLAYHNGNFVSLFPPGVSYITMPGYILGKQFSLSQVGVFAIVSLFALLNTYLLFALSRKAGAHPAAAAIASLVFLCATPAFSYGVSLSQHHITTALLLLSVWVLFTTKHWLWLSLVWFCGAVALVVDIPNAIFFLPIGVTAVMKFLILKESDKSYTLQIMPLRAITLVVMIAPLWLFANFNNQTYGNYLKLGGTAPRATGLKVVTDETTGLPRAEVTTTDVEKSPDKNAVSFFHTRRLMSGLNTHLFAKDRGMLFFTPVMFLSLLGIPLVLKKNKEMGNLLLITAGVIILLYSMWGDPYGGWAFGSRYFIPVYAMLTPFLAATLHQWRRNLIFLLFFCALTFYSLSVNTLGALTSHANPPSVELQELTRQTGVSQKEGYDRNIELIKKNKTVSLMYEQFGHRYGSAIQYGTAIVTILSLFILIELGWLMSVSRKQDHDKSL